MLLRYVVLFLNLFVAASVYLEPGWDPRHQSGPQIGGTYGISLKDAGYDVPHDTYELFVVVYQYENKCRVVRMDKVNAPGARPAMDFFGHAKLKLSAKRVLECFYVFPSEKYEVEGNPEIMRRWQERFETMSIVGVEKLMAASDGLVNGWDAQHQSWSKGGIYWVLPRDLGLQPAIGVYTPCVAFYRRGRKTCSVIKMDKLHAPGARLATEFLGNKAKLETPHGTIDFTTFYIFPSKSYEIKASPEIMQTWNGYFIQMSEESQERLLGASNGFVDGWDARIQHRLQPGDVYWVLPRYLGLTHVAGVHTPCVVIQHDENKCRVVCMHIGTIKGAKCAKKFFPGDAELATHTGMVPFKNVYFIPHDIHEVEANPKFMQLLRGHFTKMSAEGVQRLPEMSGLSSLGATRIPALDTSLT